ncbi:MAG: peptidylprolyl isomerase [Pseudomonadota bacterium]
MSVVKKGDNVKIHYTGTLHDGTVFDSSANREPLAFTLGAGQVIPGFEEAVMGMKQGESKKVTIPVEKAYGPRNEELIMPFPRNQVPPDLDPQVGQNLQLSGPNGEPVMVSVADITEDQIILDANPPLAGKELNFEIELVAIG